MLTFSVTSSTIRSGKADQWPIFEFHGAKVDRRKDVIAKRSVHQDFIFGESKSALYLGMTRSSFNHRFSRYIWSKRSQCELARQYEPLLISKGIDGFPLDITVWYARNFRGTKVRLLGSVRFAQEGIHKIWFVLFPHPKVDEIRLLEKALIPIAQKWNELSGLRPLLNI